MKNAVKVLGIVMAATAAHAGGAQTGAATSIDADPGIYGPIDAARFPKPKVINARPVVAHLPAKGGKKAKPIYLHVPSGHEQHWQAHCATYNACDVPVYFVTEGWFLNVYLPAIGAQQDGREQRYRLLMSRERDLQQRETRVERSDD